MKVLVYVEGPSDRDALQKLLRDILDDARRNRIELRFLALEGKAKILATAWRKAADELAADPTTWHFALPDLYPMRHYDGTEDEHRSFGALTALLHRRFQKRCDEMRVPLDRRHRFRVHCLKHDLEALLLAAPDSLRRRLGTTDALHSHWRRPVEDQNDDKPPKRIVEDLFMKYRKRKYVDTTDAPWILERAELAAVERACSQRLKPFVKELRVLARGGELDAATDPPA